jgi:hypothetical protein
VTDGRIIKVVRETLFDGQIKSFVVSLDAQPSFFHMVWRVYTCHGWIAAGDRLRYVFSLS